MMLSGSGCRERHRQAGFTMIELMVAMVVMGVLMGLALPTWSHYQNKQDYVASAREVVTTLRQVQMQAVSEETSYRADFTVGGRQMKVYRYDGASYVLNQTLTLPGSAATFQSPSFTTRDGAASSSAWFYARGTASDGDVTLARANTGGHTYVVHIEGLTGRVNYS